MVEFGGVYWVTQGNQVFRQVQTRLSNMRSVQNILAKAEPALTEVDFNIDNRAAMVLASKIAHEEHCEKLSLVRIIVVVVVVWYIFGITNFFFDYDKMIKQVGEHSDDIIDVSEMDVGFVAPDAGAGVSWNHGRPT